MAFEISAVRSGVAGYLSLGGKQMACSHLSVTKTGQRRGDTFSATIPISEQASVSFLTSQDGIDAGAIISIGGETKTLLSGSVDEITFDWINLSASVSGRDKSSELTQTRRSQKYSNMTAADIVKDIAKEHGLEAQIDGESGAKDVSKKYDNDTTHLVLNRTDFETISQLAEQEGVSWYVEGNTLHFGAANKDVRTYTVNYSPPTKGYIRSNAAGLTTARNFVAGRTVKATVKSWHHKDKALYSHTAKSPGTGGTLEYEMNLPGMTLEQVEKRAETAVDEAILHELAISVEMPGDLAIDPSMKLQLTGTGTIFDQSYVIQEITWEFESGESGFFSMHITGESPSEGRAAE